VLNGISEFTHVASPVSAEQLVAYVRRKLHVCVGPAALTDEVLRQSRDIIATIAQRR
jgi:hypothetical protein